jgi:hypothetical protein
MELSSINRISNPGSGGADLASAGANRVIPLAPVNPVTTSSSPAGQTTEVTPSVINLVNQANKPIVGEAVYTSLSDPARRGSEAATAPKDWTITRPEPVIQEVPAPQPITKMLTEYLRSMWRTSGSAVNQALSEQSQKGGNISQNPTAVPGEIAAEVLTYSPARIAKTAKSLASDASSSSTTP